MGLRFVFAVLIFAFGVALTLATITTIRQHAQLDRSLHREKLASPLLRLGCRRKFRVQPIHGAEHISLRLVGDLIEHGGALSLSGSASASWRYLTARAWFFGPSIDKVPTPGFPFSS
jgi:hypothetical protein